MPGKGIWNFEIEMAPFLPQVNSVVTVKLGYVASTEEDFVGVNLLSAGGVES